MEIRHETITDALVALAERQPAAPALLTPGRKTLTYADLAGQIRYVRERLSGWGISPGDIVAAVIPSRPEMAVACAALPSSSTFAPFSPSLTSHAYAELIARIRPKAVLVSRGMDHAVRAAAREHNVAELELRSDPKAPAGQFSLDLFDARDSLRATMPARPELAYVLISSGTTGRPKLVPSGHRPALLYARAAIDLLGFSPSDVGCHLVPMHLGGGLWSGLLNPLLGGLSVVCLPEADIDSFFATIEEFRPTYLNGGFALYRAILRRAPEYGGAVSRSRFRFLRCGLGRLHSEEIDRLEQTFGAPLLAAYSSTETASIAHDPLPPRPRKRGAAGLPLGNEVAVMDGTGEFSAPGTTGEIVVRGPMVFSGYLDDPQLTAQSFVGEWFRTGDLGRLDEDGYVHISGRIKDVINRGGEKVSPAEIDAVLESLQGIKEAAAFGVPHPTLGEEVVAALVRDANAAVDEAQVIEHVRRLMGPKRVPRRVYFVDRLPRTGNGKLRRAELPRLLGANPGEAAARATPGEGVGSLSPLEGALAGLWASLLGLDKVRRDDDFFLLGGDSLRGMQLIAHVKTVFGVDLSIQSLFGEAATVAGMALAIEMSRKGERTPTRGEIAVGNSPGAVTPRQRTRDPVVLSHTQRRAWFLVRLDPESPAYNESRAHRMAGAIDTEALREGLRAVIRRHEILRTTYAVVGDEPQQIVHGEEALDFACVDLRSTPPSDRNQALQSLVSAETQKPFDLDRGPLARFRLVRLGASDHVLLRVWHHIVSDGWSAGIFEGELSVAYNARVEGRAVELPALGVQYADYALWQREWLKGEVLERQLAYWKEKLAGLAVLELPTDRRRPAVQSYCGSRVEVELPRVLLESLKALGRAEGATLFMTGLAAFQVLLYRYSGAEDIAVGTPIAGRRRVELEGLIGFFANTLVLRGDLSGEPTFRELLARVRSSALSAYTHQDVPFEKLVEELAPTRDLSRNPLFQVCFALQNAPEATLALSGLEVSRLALPASNAKFDLTLTLRETEQGLRASWEYCTDLFERATIERMAGHFQVLLEAIVAEPGQRIGRLGLLSAAERHQLLVEWNRTAADYPRDRCIHELFEAQAARTPQAVAVLHEGAMLTYAELNARANQLAHYLRAAGVGPQALVGICLERGLELMVGLLGILKAGAAYVPLDPDLPRERLDFMLQDTAAAVLLTQQGLLGRLPQSARPQVCLDRDWQEIAAHSPANPASSTSPRDLAYVMYTSGSTGKPKGVAIQQEGIIRLVSNPNYVSLSPVDAIAQVSNVAFDAATFEIWGALLNGARLVILARDVTLSPASLAEALAAQRISCMFLTTALFNRISVEQPGAFRTLSYLLFGGETCDPDRVMDVLQAGGPRHLVHVYGPTETTTFATFHEVSQVESDRTIPIGQPITATEVFLLDSRGEVVPIGATGEIYIGGPGVANGYIGHSEETGARFVAHPLRGESEERVYRTGDLARRRADGSIEFLGRNDQQVKIRGFRIEPSEISATLNAYPGVRASYVMARPQASGDIGLAAYFVVKDSGRDPLQAAELRRFLSSRLPAYMVPLSFVQLPSLPLTPNGKVDHRALPDPVGDGSRPFSEYAAPRDEIERVMCRIWAEVLGIDCVGLDDNFFEIGGHSLLAARLFARIDGALDRLLPLAVLFTAPTIRALAEHYRAAPEPIGGSALVPLTAGGSLPPIYAVPGVFGDVVHVAHLARELGPSQPFYGLQSLGLDGRDVPLDSIESMATCYLREVRRTQPHGPYVLLGVCFGATVAYEMARQLFMVGEEVAFLGLLDPTRREGDEASERPRLALQAFRRVGTLSSFVMGRLRLYREEMRSLGYGDRTKYVVRKLATLGGSIAERDALKGVRRELHQDEVYRANLRALDRYERKVLRGRLRALEVFETTRTGGEGKRGPFDWSALWEGRTVLHRVPGKDSGDMLKGENVRVVATLLEDRLRLAWGS